MEQKAAPEKIVALVCEDDPADRALIAKRLIKRKYVVHEAASGHEGLLVCEKLKGAIDIILMDISMPDLSGMEVTSRLRAMDDYRETPIVAISGVIDYREKKKLDAAGFDATFLKPVDFNRLFRVMMGLTSKERERKTKLEILEEKYERLKEEHEELITSRDMADGSYKGNSMFLSYVSHEMRTPLNGVLGYTEMLLEDIAGGDFDKEEVLQCVKQIHSTGEHLLRLVNDLVEMRQIEKGEFKKVYERFSLKDLCSQLETIIAPMVEAKGILCVFNLEPSLDEVFADFARLKQVLINLLTNAIHVTAKGEIKLSIGQTTYEDLGALFFTVEDAGPFLEKKDIDTIFNRNLELGPLKHHKTTGTSVGLPLSKAIVSGFGGDIFVESKAGKGTTFKVVLPTPEIEGRRVGEGQTRILLVDDDPHIREYLKESLMERAACEEASCGKEAIELLRGREFDILVVDLHMPNLSGINLIKKLKEENICPKKVVMITGSTLKGYVERAKALGVEDFLEKPFEGEDLLDLLGLTAKVLKNAV